VDRADWLAKEDGFGEDVSFLTSAAAAGRYFKMNLNFNPSQHISLLKGELLLGHPDL
jgi:hypothetical protein